MFERLKNIFNKEVIQEHNYDFDLDFFINETDKSFFIEHGYTVIKNVVSEQAINKILEAYQVLKNHNGFYEADGFITSANYGIDIQSQIHQLLKEVNYEVLPKIFNISKIYYNLLNFLVLKFTKDKNDFFPHQDVSFLDEYKGASIILWIPTQDINKDNGSLLVLPKSHKYFRWQHTHNQTHSPLKNLHAEILKNMIPVYINKGDLILFDNALVHASAPNRTNEVRIAMNTGVASKDQELIHYRFMQNNPKKIEKFKIDEHFWHSGNFITPDNVPSVYGTPELEDLRRIKNYTLNEFKKILNN